MVGLGLVPYGLVPKVPRVLPENEIPSRLNQNPELPHLRLRRLGPTPTMLRYSYIMNILQSCI